MNRLTSLVFLVLLVAFAAACGLMFGSPGCDQSPRPTAPKAP